MKSKVFTLNIAEKLIKFRKCANVFNCNINYLHHGWVVVFLVHFFLKSKSKKNVGIYVNYGLNYLKKSIFDYILAHLRDIKVCTYVI